jgi:hypothetical protein
MDPLAYFGNQRASTFYEFRAHKSGFVGFPIKNEFCHANSEQAIDYRQTSWPWSSQFKVSVDPPAS